MKTLSKKVATATLAALSIGGLGFTAAPAEAAGATCYVTASSGAVASFPSQGKIAVNLSTQNDGQFNVSMGAGQAGSCRDGGVLEGPRNAGQFDIIVAMSRLSQGTELPEGWDLVQNGHSGEGTAPFVRECDVFSGGCPGDNDAPFGA